jgi:iron complex outermembrane receptor protein/vitamin B12 transporter
MRRTLLLAILLAAPQARAVIVRGHVTSPLGVPIPGARVQLIQGQRTVGSAIAGMDGAYEIRTDVAGRFVLLTAPSIVTTGYAPQIGNPFYGGRADLITIDIALNPAGITPQRSAQQTLVSTPKAQLATPTAQVPADQLLTEPTTLDELQSVPGAILVQLGQLGTPVSLYLSGAPPATLLTTVNGVTANPLGGAFDLSRLSSTNLSAISAVTTVEVTPTPNPLHLENATGGVLAFTPIAAESLRPTLLYTGDAGNLHAYRDEAVASWAHSRFDVLGSLSRFDLGNSVPAGPFHLIAWGANAGYHISAGTTLRFNGRYDLSAAPLASPIEIFGLEPSGRDAAQNLFASATFDTRTAGNWHNLIRYGLARTRTQTFDYATPATGLPVTLTGANGYTVSGTALFDPLPAHEYGVTNRDEATWQTDYQYKPWLDLTGEFRFQDDRAADILPTLKQTLDRTHLSAALGFQGVIHRRFFYQTSGFFDHTQLLGFTGAPRLGLTYVPVRPGPRKFHGTSLHLTLATGSREPSLLEQAAVHRPASPRSRTLDASVDQNLLSQKLTLRATYFHSQYSHEFEPISLGAIASQPVLSQTLALRTQGFESDLRYQPFARVLLEAGYNHLAALTEQSAETPTFNPRYPTTPIGALTALAGQRPFHRPPQSVFFLAEYTGSRLFASLKGAAASRSDDSTAIPQSPTLLLPNRNLDSAYTSMDANVSFTFTHHLTLFTQLANLTDDRHIAPIGYLSTPFLARAGLRVRLGGE